MEDSISKRDKDLHTFVGKDIWVKVSFKSSQISLGPASTYTSYSSKNLVVMVSPVYIRVLSLDGSRVTFNSISDKIADGHQPLLNTVSLEREFSTAYQNIVLSAPLDVITTAELLDNVSEE